MAEYKLTRKQKAFADGLLAEPKKAATLVALETYGKPNKELLYNTAHGIASENLRKPAIMAYLNEHAIEAERVMYDVMKKTQGMIEDSPGYAAVAKSAASDILDRVHGKAVQRAEIQSQSVKISIDLSSNDE